MPEVLIGVDVGTTSIKALAVTPTGQVVGQASLPTPWRHDGPRADVDPAELASTTIATCEQAAASVGGAISVRSVGVTGMAETGVLVDPAGAPCGPALAWFDPRGDAAGVREQISARDFQRATGRRLNSKPSIAKILWLQRNIPGAASAVRHLCVAEWIVRSLGGEEVSEASLASRTGLLDLANRAPWAPASELVGDLLPERRIWAGDAAGTVDGRSAALSGAVLTVAGLDHQAAVFISGAARDGALFDSLGTAEALIRTVARRMTADEMEALTDGDIDIDWSVMPDHQIMLGGRLTGLSLERISSLLGAADRDARVALGRAAVQTVRDATSPRLVNVGNDSLTLAGITDGVTPALAWRCAVEDLTALAGEALDLMHTVVGPPSASVMAGGWTFNAMVEQAKRDQLGDVTRIELHEPGAMGAAFLGGIAAGILQRPSAGGVPHWLSA